jgi:hypothetical protein
MVDWQVTELLNADIQLRCDPRVACVLPVPKQAGGTRTHPPGGRPGQSEYEVSTMGLDLCDAESLDVVEAVGRQPVEPDAVGDGVDDLVKVMEERKKCLFIGDNLENGFLNPQAVAFT